MKTNDLNTGMLRAYLDGEVNAGKGSAVAEHVDDCSDCQAELKSLSSRSASVRAGLDDLPISLRPGADTGCAWRTQSWMNPTPAGEFSGPRCACGRWPPPAPSPSPPPSSSPWPPSVHWAENLLLIFRVEHVTVLDLSSASSQGLENNQIFNQAMSHILSEDVTVTQPPQNPQPVADAAAASRLAGFKVHLIAGETPTSLLVRGAISAQMRLDRDRLQVDHRPGGRPKGDLHVPLALWTAP